MNKDVIYIDVDDDITAIISKVKTSKEKIVALVPPKRIGVLQSAVNLRLLERASQQGDKRLVLITNNHALMSLAASANLPVAKNLQSKPELVQAAAAEDDDIDDIIDGNDLPVGDHAGLKRDDEREKAVSALTAAPLEGPETVRKAAKPGASLARAKSAVKVPNFNTFRKKLIFGGVAGVFLVSFLVWAIVFAPRATVVVAAKTNDKSLNTQTSAIESGTTSPEKATVKAVISESSEDKSVELTPTGTKNVGEKATATVRFTNESLTTQTVPAGTRLTSSSGKVFITNTAAEIQGATFPCGSISCPSPGSAETEVTAADRGASYNGATGPVSGEPANVNGEFSGPSSGGTDKIAKVVTEADIQKARQALVDEEEADEVRKKVSDGFEGEVVKIEDSFATDYSDVKPSSAVGEEAPGGGTLSATVTYSMLGIEIAELETYIKDLVKEEIGDSDDQRIYDTGAKKAEFQEVEKVKKGVSFTLVATAKVGPKLDEEKIKQEARGRKFGDIQASMQNIQGVENVDVNFFPFWVSTVPDDPKKINVQFKVDE
jgi:hypothetical protein